MILKRKLLLRSDGGISIVNPVSKDQLEVTNGPLTDAQYESLVFKPSAFRRGVIPPRDLEDVDLPASREFRDAWEDSQPGTQIDINCEKAINIKLSEMRSKRIELLEAQDKLSLIAMENGDDMTAIKAEKQRLKDITNPLKELDVSGKFNDKTLLKQISELSEIQV